MLTITDLTYRVAGRTLLDGASARVPDGWKVGLIGRNGTGKSTLLELIRGQLQPDAGDIETGSGGRIGMVAQEAPGGDKTPIELVLEADSERAALLVEAETAPDADRLAQIHDRLAIIGAHAAPARAAAILAGLGFDEEMQHRPLSSYSGGWRMRVALSAVLFSAPELLLLDEPTNHLDLEATAWLENYLQSYPHTLLIVSHDRRLLNAVPDHILHLDQAKLTLYAGGYDLFEERRALRIEQSKAEVVKQEARRAHLQAFVDRFRAKATKARQAQSRLKMIAKMTPVAAIADDPTISFDFPDPPELRPPLISIDKGAVGYEPGQPVLGDLNLRLDPDDRIALLGANGNGKSTLAKLLAGRLALQAGRQHRSPKLKIGFFAQHQIEDMVPEDTPFDHLARLIPKAPPIDVRARLGRFGFGQDKAFVKVKSLSGGERARLNFALITHDAPSLMILDEPTNHLDIDSRAALATAINEFSGAVILISHDWYLLELTMDRLWLVAGGKVVPYEGDLEDYRRAMLAARTTTFGKPASPRAKAIGRMPPRSLEPLRRAARQAETAMRSLAQEKQTVEAALAKSDLAAADRVNLMRRHAELFGAVETAEETWLIAEEALQEAQQLVAK
ncbi:MAG TPA: ABC-F family ATP-binding cassette domain-containing protein [Stellaceae bacterium]|jgi:ATP-binding cassette subfamily F protein 3|nr:ABC-F family ATP-binding cassette domain-containing protein [Stellaceae bacterium]